MNDVGPRHRHRMNGTDYVRGCRCMTCTVANANRARRIRNRRRADRVLINGRMIAPLPPEQHGLASTYRNHGCRCEPCTSANTVACTRHRAEARIRRGAT